jgi:tetrahydromethanopterin S-methyltransferase subunit B
LDEGWDRDTALDEGWDRDGDGSSGERKRLAAMWACATKSDGRDKSRFLPKGCGQRAGTDYNETWAPVAKLVTLRIFLSLVAILQLFTLQMDIKTAFLNADIEETVFVKPVYDRIFILKLLYERDLIRCCISQQSSGPDTRSFPRRRGHEAQEGHVRRLYY